MLKTHAETKQDILTVLRRLHTIKNHLFPLSEVRDFNRRD